MQKDDLPKKPTSNIYNIHVHVHVHVHVYSCVVLCIVSDHSLFSQTLTCTCKHSLFGTIMYPKI